MVDFSTLLSSYKQWKWDDGSLEGLAEALKFSEPSGRIRVLVGMPSFLQHEPCKVWAVGENCIYAFEVGPRLPNAISIFPYRGRLKRIETAIMDQKIFINRAEIIVTLDGDEVIRIPVGISIDDPDLMKEIAWIASNAVK